MVKLMMNDQNRFVKKGHTNVPVMSIELLRFSQGS